MQANARVCSGGQVSPTMCPGAEQTGGKDEKGLG